MKNMNEKFFSCSLKKKNGSPMFTAIVILTLILISSGPLNMQPGASPVFHQGTGVMASDWSPLAAIIPESTGRAVNPDIAIDALGNVHMVWVDNTDISGAGTDYDILYRKKVGGSWMSPEVVSVESTGTSGNPSVYVDQNNDVHVAWEDNTDYLSCGTDIDIFYKVKDVSAGTWSTAEVVSAECDMISTHPSLAVDGTGRVHVAWEDETNYGGASGSDPDVFYKSKDPVSGNWTIPEIVSNDVVDWEVGDPAIDVDSSNTVHIVYVDFQPSVMYYDTWPAAYRSKPSGGSWSAKYNFKGVEGVDYQLVGDPTIKVDDIGNIHVGFGEYGACPPFVGTGMFYKHKHPSYGWMGSDDLSNTANQELDYVGPSIDLDSQGNVHFVWTELDQVYHNTMNITTMMWGVAEVISTGIQGPAHDPVIKLDGNDDIHVIMSNNTYSGSDSPDVYYTTTAEITDLLPVADFTADMTVIKEGDSVQFTFTGIPGDVPATFDWNFGDGSQNSTDQNPMHQYTIPGNFQVTLTVRDNDGDADVETKLDYIQVIPNSHPVAEFTCDSTLITVNHEVSFTDLSIDSDGTIISWSWDFGDGSPESNEQHPVHYYYGVGTFTVSLTVEDDSSAVDEEVKVNYIQVVENQLPVPDFNISSSNTVIGDTVEFTDLSSDPDGTIVYWYWDFGDGSDHGIGANPTHHYTSAGNYTVALIMEDDYGWTNTISKDIEIQSPEIYVYSIDMWHEQVFTHNGWILDGFDIYTQVVVHDEFGTPLSGVEVTVDLECPGGGIVSLTGITDVNGSVILLEEAGWTCNGTFTSTVTSLVQPFCIYNSALNIETSENQYVN